MNIEAESYRQAFGFGQTSREEFQKLIDAKGTEVAQRWAALKSRQAKLVGVIDWFRLLFVDWVEIWATKDQPCAVTSMSGFPLYEYKELDGKVCYLRPQRSPGFPGS